VQVPFVQGITEGLARDKIRNAGLDPRIVRRPNETVPVGIVFDQTPKGGDHASKGNQVQIIVSTGKPKVEVPNVKGNTLADAVKSLTQAGLNYKEFDIHSSATPGTVTGQAPAPGTSVIKGTTVRINISRGLPPVIIPSDLIGKTEADASAELQQLGFNVGPSQPQDSSQPKGQVIDTNPKPGTSVQRGSAVSLIVSKGPQTAPVPDVRGFAVATAVQTIRAAGFKPVVQHQDTSDQTQDGVVIAEVPDPNTQAALATPVTITVGHYVPPAPTGPTGPTGTGGTIP
jgi:serine/threonine-protein kinase